MGQLTKTNYRIRGIKIRFFSDSDTCSMYNLFLKRKILKTKFNSYMAVPHT